MADGETTARELLVAKWKLTGICPPEIDEHDLPPLTAYLWRWWQELFNARPAGMGWSGIPPSEIESWARMSGRNLAAWEYRAIRRIDDLFLEAKQLQARADHEREKQGKPAAQK